MAGRKGRRAQKPIWERGYRGHVFWQGKLKLGKVTLQPAAQRSEGARYTWEAAGRLGRADTLRKAKFAVEMTVATSEKQLPLFD